MQATDAEYRHERFEYDNRTERGNHSLAPAEMPLKKGHFRPAAAGWFPAAAIAENCDYDSLPTGQRTS
jgi:hypothetical protein